jgi:hypothetical protein
MLEGRKLRKERDATVKKFNKFINEALKNGDKDLAKKIRGDRDFEVYEKEFEIESYESTRVVDVADRLDVELPASDEADSWILEPPKGKLLSSKGRSIVRKRIHEEKVRRFELKSRWIQILTPILAALAGVVGTVTGLVAVIKKH